MDVYLKIYLSTSPKKKKKKKKKKPLFAFRFSGHLPETNLFFFLALETNIINFVLSTFKVSFFVLNQSATLLHCFVDHECIMEVLRGVASGAAGAARAAPLF